MTVTLPPAPQHRIYSTAEKRDHVVAYPNSAHGTKGAYLDTHTITRDQMRRWKDAMADGDLDTDRRPRKTGRMTDDDIAEVTRLQQTNEKARTELEQARLDLADLRHELNAVQHDHEQEIQAQQQRFDKLLADKETSIQSHIQAVDSLGKAIAAMQHRSTP